MIINSQEVGLESCKPVWDSGIDWRKIGASWKCIDNGVESSHYSTQITIAAEPSQVMAVYRLLKTSSISGDSISITCEDYERIFGVEFNAETAYTCFVESDSIYTTDCAENSALQRIAFNVYTNEDLYTNRATVAASFPDVCAKSISHNAGNAFSMSIMETGVSCVGFGYRSATCEAEFIGKKSDIIKLKSYIQGVRSTSFSLTAPTATDQFYFEQYEGEVSVYCMGMVDNGKLDIAGKWWSVTLTLGKA